MTVVVKRRKASATGDELPPGAYRGPEGIEEMKRLTEEEAIQRSVLVSSTASAPRTAPRTAPHHFSSQGTIPSIFDQDLDLECPNPRTSTRVDFATGELIEVPKHRFDTYTNKWIPVRCNRMDCSACCIINARKIARAIWLSQPDYVLTLTLVGDMAEKIWQRIDKFAAAMRKMYPTFEYTCQIEPNPGGTGNHAILYIHVADKSITKEAVAKVWKTRFELKRVFPHPTFSYFGYQMKCLLDPEQQRVFFALNGTPGKQYLVHASRRFWRDGRGGPGLSREKAAQLAHSRRFP